MNHNGSLDLAYQLVDVAVLAGVDAVKFQTFKAESLLTLDAPKAAYQMENTDVSQSQYDMLRSLELSDEAHRDLVTYCQEKGVLFMSTPFDEESADFLDDLGVAVLKIPSGEITNLSLLIHVARKGKPVIVSTGMADIGEVGRAVKTICGAGNNDLALLHCISQYPAEPADANLRAMRTMAMAFEVPVGYSDHTLGTEVALGAVALGACVIEKHFTLDRNLPGPDHQASLEPDELAGLVKGIRVVESALGHGRKEPADCEASIAAVARRSLVATLDIPAGTTLTEEMISVRRPGTGLMPSALPYMIGRVSRITIPAGTVLTLEMLT